MKSLNKSKFQSLPLATLFLLCVSLVWQSPVLAKKPILDDRLLDAYTAADTLEDGSGRLVFIGKEKLKLSQCCKPPKEEITLEMSIEAGPGFGNSRGNWKITAFRDEELGFIDDPTPLFPESGDEVFIADPIEGNYNPKNKVWNILKFHNVDEELQFMALIEVWASDVAGEDVYLGNKKPKLRIKVKEKDDGSYKLLFRARFGLRRAANEDREGDPTLGSGVYKIKARAVVPAPVPVAAPAP